MVIEIMELPTSPMENAITFMYRQEGEKAWNKYRISTMAIVMSDVPLGTLLKNAMENLYDTYEPNFIYVPYRGEL